MAWAWSFTNEGVQNIRDNLFNLDKETLIEIYCEIKASTMTEHFSYDFNDVKFEYLMKYVTDQVNHNLALDVIAEAIWTFASEELRTCDNGGFYAWLCPYGCHTVSLDKENK